MEARRPLARCLIVLLLVRGAAFAENAGKPISPPATRPAVPAAPGLPIPELGPLFRNPAAPAAPVPAGAPQRERAASRSFGSLRDAFLARADQVRGALGIDVENLAQRPEDGAKLETAYDGAQEHVAPLFVPDENGNAQVISAEGVPLLDRAAAYFLEVRRLSHELSKKGIDLSESLDVMDDAYGEVWAKLRAIEVIGKNRRLEGSSIHLPLTLTYLDALYKERDRTVALHTTRVFFHRAGNRRSEMQEGMRRVDGYLREMTFLFQSGGKAEQKTGKVIDDVVLAFDVRGYPEIKDHIRYRAKEIERKYGARYKLVFLDELAQMPANVSEMRAQVANLTRRYGQEAVSNIIEGVVYSRYVGLLLELKTIEYFVARGYKILQSGREIFNAQGMYVTELDTVVEAPDGRRFLVEAKSARVPLSKNHMMQSKFLYKLATYRDNRKLLENAVGGPFAGVIFSVDLGALSLEGDGAALAHRGQQEGENDDDYYERQAKTNEKTIRFLRQKEKELSKKYHMPIGFLFLESHPGSQPLLQSKPPELLDAKPVSAKPKKTARQRRKEKRRREKAGRQFGRRR